MDTGLLGTAGRIAQSLVVLVQREDTDCVLTHQPALLNLLALSTAQAAMNPTTNS